MRNLRSITAGLAALAVSSAYAQITGPTPLAWRWVQPTSVAPSGAPVVSGDTAFVAVGGRVFGLDRETGNQKWKYPQSEGIQGFFRSGVIFHEGTLLAAGDNKTVYAVDASNGEPKYQIQLQSAVVGTPVVSNKLLIVALADNTMMAYNIGDGSPAWPGPVRLFDGLLGNPVAVGGSVVFFTQRYELVSMNTITQKSDWRQRFQQISGDVTPVLYGDNLYISSGPFVNVLNAARGTVRWSKNVGETLVFNPVVTGAGVAVASREGSLLFLNPNGQQVMRKDDKGRSVPARIDLGSVPAAGPAAVGNLVAVPTTSGALNLYDPTDLSLKWAYTIRPYTSGLKFKTTGANATEKPLIAIPAAGSPVSVDNTLMLLALDGSLLCFDAAFGVDTTAPEVKMVWPAPGAQVNGQTLDVVFQISDEATGIRDDSLKIDVNGQPCKVEFGQDGIGVVRFNAFAKNPGLGDRKRANFTVDVTDWMGNNRKSSFSLYIDNSLRPLGIPKDTPTGTGGGAGGGPSKGGGGTLGGGGG